MQNKVYITTTLPYVNADPHLGFALEIVQADTLARYWQFIQGKTVVFNTGTDEHGQKIYQKALEESKDPQKYCDEYAAKFHRLKASLNLSYTNFIRTTDSYHIEAAKEFWKKCYQNGDIYKKNYKIRYCVGCELEKTDSELVDDGCPLHPKLKLEIIEEENYFFKFSRYQDKLLAFYEKTPDFVIPDFRFKEIKAFVKNGLEDFSVSRLKSKMPWGIDIPNDPSQVMYVWFDALINYIATLGWPKNKKKFAAFWPGIQVAGKDNLRQQSAMWQAMLMSANVSPSKQIIIHGFITSDGKKMSKSLGNVINPFALVKQYGTDAVRYYLLKEIPAFDDGDFSHTRMQEIYNADLANGLGNLVARVTRLCEQNNIVMDNQPIETIELPNSLKQGGFIEHIESFEFNLALEEIWKDLKDLDAVINEDKPWDISKTDVVPKLKYYVKEIRKRVKFLVPFLPKTSKTILDKTQGKIVKTPPLFPRIK